MCTKAGLVRKKKKASTAMNDIRDAHTMAVARSGPSAVAVAMSAVPAATRRWKAGRGQRAPHRATATDATKAAPLRTASASRPFPADEAPRTASPPVTPPKA
jgi:hypothetical protein